MARPACPSARPWSAAFRYHATAWVLSGLTPLPYWYRSPRTYCASGFPWFASRRSAATSMSAVTAGVCRPTGTGSLCCREHAARPTTADDTAIQITKRFRVSNAYLKVKCRVPPRSGPSRGRRATESRSVVASSGPLRSTRRLNTLSDTQAGWPQAEIPV